MKLNKIFRAVCVLGLFSASMAWAAGDQNSPRGGNPCERLLWRGAEPESNLSHLDHDQRRARISSHDYNETLQFFVNLAEYYSGNRTLEVATAYPNSFHTPNFIIAHFSEVYSTRAQFDFFANTLRQMAEAMGISTRTISPGHLVPAQVSIRDAWQDLFLNMAFAQENIDNLHLLTLALYLELKLSETQHHTLAFLDDEAHAAFENMLRQVVQNWIDATGADSKIASAVSQLGKTYQLLARERSQSASENKVEASIFQGRSQFAQALQKVELPKLRTALVEYESVLVPLIHYLAETCAGRPAICEEMVRRSAQTIRSEIPDVAQNPNYVIGLPKLRKISEGTLNFVTDAFNFSKFQGLWSFAAIFKNLPYPDQLPADAKNSIRALFQKMDKPQSLPD